MGERDLSFGIPWDYVGPFYLASLLSLVPLSGAPLSGAGQLGDSYSSDPVTRLIQSNYTPKNLKLLGQMTFLSFAEEK